MARRRRRKRRKVSWLMIVALALIIAGFVARRLMMPSAARYLTHTAPDYSSAPSSAEQPAANHAPAAARNGSGEHLSDSDRRALDAVIRHKTEGN